MDYIASHEEDFCPFIEDDETFTEYVERLREDCEWGGNLEIQVPLESTEDVC